MPQNGIAADAGLWSGGGEDDRSTPRITSGGRSRSRSRTWMRALGVALAGPGMYLVYKYNQYRRQAAETHRRKVTEKELSHLNNKIEKLLAKLDEQDVVVGEGDDVTSPPAAAIIPNLKLEEEVSIYNRQRDEECVVCLSAKATMQTFPCGHKVVCRKCFVKTIQVAVTQRCLPLRCVVCRTRILKLKQTADDTRSMGAGGGGETGGDKGSSRVGGTLKHLFSSSGNRGSPPAKQPSTPSKPVATKIMQPLLIFPSDSAPKPRTFSPANTAAPPKASSALKQQHHIKEPSPILKHSTISSVDGVDNAAFTTDHYCPTMGLLPAASTARRTNNRRSRSASRATTTSTTQRNSAASSKHVTFAEPLSVTPGERRVHAAHVCCVQQDTPSAGSLLSPRVTRCPRNGHQDLTHGSMLISPPRQQQQQHSNSTHKEVSVVYGDSSTNSPKRHGAGGSSVRSSSSSAASSPHRGCCSPHHSRSGRNSHTHGGQLVKQGV